MNKNIAFASSLSTLSFSDLEQVAGGYDFGRTLRAGAQDAVKGAIGGGVAGAFAGGVTLPVVGAVPGWAGGAILGGIGGGIAGAVGDAGSQLGIW